MFLTYHGTDQKEEEKLVFLGRMNTCAKILTFPPHRDWLFVTTSPGRGLVDRSCFSSTYQASVVTYSFLLPQQQPLFDNDWLSRRLWSSHKKKPFGAQNASVDIHSDHRPFLSSINTPLFPALPFFCFLFRARTSWTLLPSILTSIYQSSVCYLLTISRYHMEESCHLSTISSAVS